MAKTLKTAKVFETGDISLELWSEEVCYVFEGREDTTTFFVGTEGFDKLNAMLIEMGCKHDEKVIIERGSW